MSKVFVVFAAAYPITEGNLLTRWFRRAVIRAVEKGTDSELVHVAVIVGDVVLNPRITGNEIHESVAFIMGHPGLVWIVELTVERHVSLHHFAATAPRRKSMLSSVLQVCTDGLWQSQDCVATTCRVLRLAGVGVPRGVTTPAGLFDWLRKEGYHCAELA